MVILQHSAESLATFDLAGNCTDLIAGHNDIVGQTLMISFGVIMGEVFASTRVDGEFIISP